MYSNSYVEIEPIAGKVGIHPPHKPYNALILKRTMADNTLAPIGNCNRLWLETRVSDIK
jgi:hypothetical protein